MAKVIRYSVKRGDTVAGVKAWITELHEMMLAAGLVVTSDTGQLDINAIGAVNNTLIAYGYLMYELVDSQSSNLRLLIKIEPFGQTWGSTGGVGYGPGCYITVGSQTDGAGNFTGACKTVRQAGVGNHGSYGQAGVAGSTPSIVFAADGRVVIVYGYGAHVYSSNFGTVAFAVISRSTDDNGVFNANGIHTLLHGQRQALTSQTYSPSWSQYITPAAAYDAISNAAPCVGTPALNGQAGGVMQCQRVYSATPELITMRDVVSAASAVMSPFSTMQIEHFSEGPREFMALGNLAPVPDYYFNQSGWAFAVAVDE